MSRTYRRRGSSYLHARELREYFQPEYLLEEDVWTVITPGYYVPLAPRSPEGKKILARFHSDAGFGSYSGATAPRWYRRMLNKRASYREEQLLRRDPDPVLPPRVSDAGWYW